MSGGWGGGKHEGAIKRRRALLGDGHGDLGRLELGEGDVHAREAHSLGMAHRGVAVLDIVDDLPVGARRVRSIRGAMHCLPAVFGMKLAVGRRRGAICSGCRRGRLPPRLLAARALALAPALGLGLGLGLDVDGCLAIRRGSLAACLVLLICAHVHGPRAVIAAAGHLKECKREGGGWEEGRRSGGVVW